MTPNADESSEKLDYSCIIGGEVNVSYFRKDQGSFLQN